MSLTILITANHMISHPSIDVIRMTLESLSILTLPGDTQILLAHNYGDKKEYLEYLVNLNDYIKDTSNVHFTIRTDYDAHLTGNIRHAMQFIDTDYVFIIQQDLPFIRPVNIQKVLEDMEENPDLKHVRFNHRKNIKALFDSINDLFGKQILCKNFTYTRTPGWSDRNHLCRTSYYKDFVLNECQDGTFMENTLQGRCKTEEDHIMYGTYLFDVLDADAVTFDLDGRRFIQSHSIEQ